MLIQKPTNVDVLQAFRLPPQLLKKKKKTKFKNRIGLLKHEIASDFKFKNADNKRQFLSSMKESRLKKKIRSILLVKVAPICDNLSQNDTKKCYAPVTR